jgi:UTP--glucose-1-phosphate uridylyltransferase
VPGSLPTETYAATVAADRTGSHASATSETDAANPAAASSGRRFRAASTWSRSAVLAAECPGPTPAAYDRSMASKGNPQGLALAREKMRQAGVDEVAIDTFAHYYRLLEHGETGMIAEGSIEPLDMESLADVEVAEGDAAEAIRKTAVIKLNGGLGTSMGMERAKSLLCVRRGLSFLDIIARQVLHLRKEYDATLPLLFMNSFRTSSDTMAALARYEDLPVEGLPLEFLQNKEPKLLAADLMPAAYPKQPDLEWCPPGHGDIYTALRGTGLLARLLDAGYRYVFVSNSDNLGAVPDARVAGWFAQSGAPFAIEAVRRTPSDRKGGHFARRKADGRIVLRESAQTLDVDKDALADLNRHKYCSTNNLWFDLQAMVDALDGRGGILGLPLIKNVKHLDPADRSTPEVIQIETAMGAAIEVFEGALTIEVGRDRFVPVKTTDDLLVLRSDVYDLGRDFVLDQAGDEVPFVSLDGDFYKLVGDFDKRFPEGAPSLREAESFTVEGDWTFGKGVRVVGDVALEASSAQRIEGGTVLSEPDPAQGTDG